MRRFLQQHTLSPAAGVAAAAWLVWSPLESVPPLPTGAALVLAGLCALHWMLQAHTDEDD